MEIQTPRAQCRSIRTISMMKWIRTSRLSIIISLEREDLVVLRAECTVLVHYRVREKERHGIREVGRENRREEKKVRDREGGSERHHRGPPEPW